ncbi:MAG: hypothetical protein HYX81_01810 [Chloroflexi bacterium]|nr:hypothetical protein [Chloroflexota bacterium]MBI4267730.1 hypothetical protein [Chloroflexota bacterium]
MAMRGLFEPASIGLMESISIRRALARGAVHAAMGSMIAIALLLFPRFPVVIALAVCTVTFLTFEAARLDMPYVRRYFFVLFAPVMRKEEENQLTGGSYLLIGSLVSALVFPAYIASIAIVFLALGDPTAGIVGRWLGKTPVWRKNLEGNFACFAACLLGGGLVAGFLSPQPVIMLVFGAFAATVCQALPWRLNDNLTIPIGSGLVMMLVSSLTL